LFISVATFAGGVPKGDDEPFFGKMFGTSCEIYGYGFWCCKHTFWIEHTCGFSNTDLGN
jgi:hypothetical protein